MNKFINKETKMKPISGDKIEVYDTGTRGTIIKVYENNTCDVLVNDSYDDTEENIYLRSESYYDIESDIDFRDISILEREYLISKLTLNAGSLIATLVPVIRKYMPVNNRFIESYSYDFNSQEKYIIHDSTSIYWEYLIQEPEEHKTIVMADFYDHMVRFDFFWEKVKMSKI